MANIHLSPDWVPSMVNRMTSNSVNASVSVLAASQVSLLQPGAGYSGNAMGQICIMQGSVPTDFSTLTSVNSRLSDILIRYTVSYSGLPSMGDFATSQFNVNPLNVSTQYRAATASGTATWFWWFAVPTTGGGSSSDSSPLFHQIIGTVGPPLSGADLEIPTTSIVSGEQYRIMNLRIQFPTTWTY